MLGQLTDSSSIRGVESSNETKRNMMKQFLIILLSLLLLYAGVASAFANCAFDWGHEHATHSHPGAELADDNTKPASPASIHCAKLASRLGPMATNVQLRVPNASKYVLFPNSRIASDHQHQDTTRDYPLKILSFRSSSISFATNSSHLHRLLAVLQI